MPAQTKLAMTRLSISIFFVLAGLGALIYGLLVALPPESPGLIVWGIITGFWGLFSIALRKTQIVVNLHLTAVMILFVTVAMAETFIRVAIALDVPLFKNPILYTDPYSDDEYWKLTYQWDGGGLNGARHPVLGWIPPITDENPLGLIANSPYKPDYGSDAILFFGNSFTAGTHQVPISQRVPQQVGRMLGFGATAYNFSVGGYGVDQIYLRMDEHMDSFERPYIVFGLLTIDDLDHVVLTGRPYPKPRFRLADGQLELTNVPIPIDPQADLDANKVQFSSYTSAMLTNFYRAIVGGDLRHKEVRYKRDEKVKLVRAIIEATVERCRQAKTPLLFVVYYTRFELTYQGWREVYIRELLTELSIPFVDVKELFLKVKHQNVKQASVSYYLPVNGHLTYRRESRRSGRDRRPPSQGGFIRYEHPTKPPVDGGFSSLNRLENNGARAITACIRGKPRQCDGNLSVGRGSRCKFASKDWD